MWCRRLKCGEKIDNTKKDGFGRKNEIGKVSDLKLG